MYMYTYMYMCMYLCMYVYIYIYIYIYTYYIGRRGRGQPQWLAQPCRHRSGSRSRRGGGALPRRHASSR